MGKDFDPTAAEGGNITAAAGDAGAESPQPHGSGDPLEHLFPIGLSTELPYPSRRGITSLGIGNIANLMSKYIWALSTYMYILHADSDHMTSFFKRFKMVSSASSFMKLSKVINEK